MTLRRGRFLILFVLFSLMVMNSNAKIVWGHRTSHSDMRYVEKVEHLFRNSSSHLPRESHPADWWGPLRLVNGNYLCHSCSYVYFWVKHPDCSNSGSWLEWQPPWNDPVSFGKGTSHRDFTPPLFSSGRYLWALTWSRCTFVAAEENRWEDARGVLWAGLWSGWARLLPRW